MLLEKQEWGRRLYAAMLRSQADHRREETVVSLSEITAVCSAERERVSGWFRPMNSIYLILRCIRVRRHRHRLCAP